MQKIFPIGHTNLLYLLNTWQQLLSYWAKICRSPASEVAIQLRPAVKESEKKLTRWKRSRVLPTSRQQNIRSSAIKKDYRLDGKGLSTEKTELRKIKKRLWGRPGAIL